MKAQLADPVDGEAALLEAALTMSVERFYRHVKAWTIKHAPVAQEREAAKEARQQVLNMFEKDGGWVLNGFLTDKNGQMVNTMLTAAMGRKETGDERAYNERRAGALLNIFTKVTQYGDTQPTARVVPHVSALVDFDTLVTAGLRAREAADPATCELDGSSDAGADGEVVAELGRLKAVIPSGIGAANFRGLDPATLDNGTPLTPSQLQMLLCDSKIARIVLGTGSAEVDVGRISRTCTPKQARAVIARDRSCRYPGCDQPYQSSNIHHVQHWQNGGNTDIDNLVMLCWFHHEKVHQDNITIKHYERGWLFVDQYGNPIADPHDRRPDHAYPADHAYPPGHNHMPDHGHLADHGNQGWTVPTPDEYPLNGEDAETMSLFDDVYLSDPENHLEQAGDFTEPTGAFPEPTMRSQAAS